MVQLSFDIDLLKKMRWKLAMSDLFPPKGVFWLEMPERIWIFLCLNYSFYLQTSTGDFFRRSNRVGGLIFPPLFFYPSNGVN